jgi:hypothetical protein
MDFGVLTITKSSSTAHKQKVGMMNPAIFWKKARMVLGSIRPCCQKHNIIELLIC